VNVLQEGRLLYPGKEGRMCAETLVPLYEITHFVVVYIRTLETVGPLDPV